MSLVHTHGVCLAPTHCCSESEAGIASTQGVRGHELHTRMRQRSMFARFLPLYPSPTRRGRVLNDPGRVPMRAFIHAPLGDATRRRALRCSNDLAMCIQHAAQVIGCNAQHHPPLSQLAAPADIRTFSEHTAGASAFKVACRIE